MDENNAPANTDTGIVNEGNTPEPVAPATETGSGQEPVQPSEPTGPAPQTPDPDMPDHGINPDEGIDPDAGDEAPLDAEPQQPANDNDQPDLSKMTRRERAEYFSEQANQQRRQVEQSINAVYQAQPVNELKEQYLNETDEYGNAKYDDFQATILAREQVREQQAQINEARAEIAELNASLRTQAMEVVHTIPWLNSQNKEVYDEKSTEAASNLYERLAITKDPRTGQIIEAKIQPQEFYNLIDQIRNSGSNEAGIKAQKAAERQFAAVAAPSSASQSREASFDSMNLDQQREYLAKKGHYVT